MGKTKELTPEIKDGIFNNDISEAQILVNCVDYSLADMATDIFTNAKSYANKDGLIITDSVEVALEIFRTTIYTKSISYYFSNGQWILSLEFYTPGNDNYQDAGHFNYLVYADECNKDLNAAVSLYNNPLAFLTSDNSTNFEEYQTTVTGKAFTYLCAMFRKEEEFKSLCLTNLQFHESTGVKELPLTFFHIYEKPENNNVIIKELIKA